MSRILLLLFMLAGSQLSVCAQGVLHETSTRSTDIPAFSFIGSPQCDDLKDTFFLVEGSPSNQGGSAIVRLNGDNSPYIFDIPESQNARLVRYYVDSQTGELSVVTETAGGTTLTTFARSGHQTGKTLLKVPTGLVVDAIASHGNTLLVAGFIDGTASAQDRMRTFVGLFDSETGQMQRSIPSLSGRPITPNDLHGPRDQAAVADGGYFYVAAFGAIARVDGNGAAQQILLSRPAATTVVSSLTRSGGSLTFQLTTPHPKNSPSHPLEFDVVDSQTMQVTQRVSSSPELGNTMICAKDSYVFLKPVNGMLRFITAAAP